MLTITVQRSDEKTETFHAGAGHVLNQESTKNALLTDFNAMVDKIKQNHCN